MNETLTSLDLRRQSGIGFGSEGAEALTRALAVNCGLCEYSGPGEPLLPNAERQANRTQCEFFFFFCFDFESEAMN